MCLVFKGGNACLRDFVMADNMLHTTLPYMAVSTPEVRRMSF